MLTVAITTVTLNRYKMEKKQKKHTDGTVPKCTCNLQNYRKRLLNQYLTRTLTFLK